MDPQSPLCMEKILEMNYSGLPFWVPAVKLLHAHIMLLYLQLIYVFGIYATTISINSLNLIMEYVFIPDPNIHRASSGKAHARNRRMR